MKHLGSLVWAALMLGAIVGWLALNTYAKKTVTAEETALQSANAKSSIAKPLRVQVRRVTATSRREILTIRGRTESESMVNVRARTDGQVISLGADKGNFVKKGSVLCTLDMGTRAARLAEAEAVLAQAELDYKASATLMKRGYAPETQEAARKAKRDAALAIIKQVRIDIERTKIKAPFDGVVEDQPSKVGDLLKNGDVCAKLVSQDPILVVGEVTESEVAKLKIGMPATANLVTGEKAEGQIRFVAQMADAATRTFRVEIKVPNTERKLRSGITSQINVPLKESPAHMLAYSILSLSDNGRIGVRLVNTDNTIRFQPVTILDESKGGVWVSGLPEVARLITVGQDYVREGQTVEPVELTAEAGS